MAEKVRQLLELTMDEDWKRKLLESVSMMRIMKKVYASKAVSVVSQMVGSEGFSRVLTVRVSVL
jgi:hypothetical protein